jgi:hypothetical protein
MLKVELPGFVANYYDFLLSIVGPPPTCDLDVDYDV